MFGRRRTSKDFAEEIKAHLELEADELREAGISDAEAKRRARVAFGNVGVVQERFAMRGRFEWLDKWVRDLRFGVRSLLKSPGFTVTVVLTLGLGIGANTAVFSVMNAVLLKSLPVADPERVVYLRIDGPPRGTGTVDSQETLSYPVYDALRKEKRAMQELIAYVPLSGGKVAVRVGSQPEEAEGDMVSGAFFSGLGVKLAMGRGFQEEDERDHAPFAVISYNYWTREFARSRDVLGKTLYVNGVAMTIVGVSAQGFEGVEGGMSTDFWIPLQNRRELNAWGNPPEEGKIYTNNPTWWCLRLVGRLAPGVTRAQALAQLQPVFQRAAYTGIGMKMDEDKPPVLSLVDAKNFGNSDEAYGKPRRVLMAMVGLVLLIALTNVVMLLMARNAARQREFSLRLALGAGRGELMRQLLTESALLVTAGGGLAWGFAEVATRLLARGAQIESSLTPDKTVLLFTLGLLVAAAVLFGVAPLRVAMRGGAELALRTSAATSNSDAGKTRAGRVIVAMQMALCVVLLVGGGLLIRTLRNLENTPLGVNTDGLVVFGVKPDIPTVPQGIAFYNELMRRLRVLPGVESVTIMEERLGSWWSDNSDMQVDGKLPDVANGGSRTVRQNIAGPDFFTTLQVPVLMGRDFKASDNAGSPHVTIVNEEFVRRFLPNENPLGHLVSADDGRFTMTIVGVVKNHKYRAITEDPIPMAWFMFAQIPVVSAMNVEMRVQGNPLAILPSAQKVVQQMDSNLPLIQPMLQRAQYDTTISNQVLFARLAGFFGLLAVVLVATGLYGTLSYRVNLRTAEIGVRMAVGAGRGQVVWMVLKDSLLLAAVGIGVGVPMAMLIGKALTASLYGVTPLDAVSYLAAVVGLVVVALAASAVPAGRAASIDPLRALRTE